MAQKERGVKRMADMTTELARKKKVNCFAVLMGKEEKWAEETIEQCLAGGEGAFTVLERRLQELAAGRSQMKGLLEERQ